HRANGIAAHTDDKEKPFSAAALGDDAAGRYVFVEPAVAEFGAGRGQTFLEAAFGGGKAVEAPQIICREACDTVEFCGKGSVRPVAFAAEPLDLTGGLLESEALLGDLADLVKAAKGVEQIQQRCVGRAELALQRIGLSTEQFSDLFG